MDHRLLYDLLPLELLFLGEIEGYDCVGPGTGGIHQGASKSLVFVALFNDLFDLFELSHLKLTQVFDVHSQLGGLSDFKSSLFPAIHLHQQILNFFIVNLQHRHFQDGLAVGFVQLGPSFSREQIFTHDWNDSFVGPVAKNTVGLPSPCLSVGKDAAVEALDEIGQQFFSEKPVNFLLIDVLGKLVLGLAIAHHIGLEFIVGPKTVVKRELLHCLSFLVKHLHLLTAHLDAELGIQGLFPVVEGPYSNCDVNVHYRYKFEFGVIGNILDE